MTGILLTVLPWVILTGLLFLSGKLFLLWRDEKKKVVIEKKKSEKMKINIDQLVGYHSDDQEIRASAEKNIKEFKEAKTNEKVKEKFDKFYTDINTIYYRD